MSAEEYYQKGNEARKRGQWHEAINAYIQAIELDPDSPAVEAKRMLDDNTLQRSSIMHYELCIMHYL